MQNTNTYNAILNKHHIYTHIFTLTWKVLVLESISVLCSLWRLMSASAPVARSSVQINDFILLTYKNNNVDISEESLSQHGHNREI